MLKPKRKITRKEIEKDPFLEGVFSLKQHLDNKKQQYFKIGAVVIAVVLITFFVNRNSVTNQNDADYGVGIGMVYLNKGDYQNAIMQFQQIVGGGGGGGAGYNATFYIGKIHFDRGNYDLALPHFERFISGSNNDFILSSAYELLSAIYESKDKLNEAISYQKKSINKSISKLGSSFSKLRLAKLYILNKNKELAVKYMNEVIDVHEDNFEIKKEYDFLYGLIGGLS